MSLDPRYVELMNAEVDGVNSHQGSADLATFLASDASARKYFEQLKQLSGVLARVEAVHPPADGKQRILDALRPRGVRIESVSFFRSVRNAIPRGRLALRYGYAMAAGLLLGLGVYHVASVSGSGPQSLDPAAVAGTMTPGTARHAPAPILEVPVTSTDVTGSARLSRADAGFLIEVDLDAHKPVHVVLGYDPAAVGFRGFAQDLDAVQGLDITSEHIAWTQDARRRVAVVITPRTGSKSVIDLRFFVSGTQVGGSSFSLPAPGDEGS